ncbi:MAG: hypothetical protein ACI9KE_005337 [Polyangiales bacterium]|jgi:hypothetical protein
MIRRSISTGLPFSLALLLGGLSACQTGGRPDAFGLTPEGDGPRIKWDLNNDALPEIPLPNDIATWPDRTSPTGRRINVSMLAPTGFERFTRELFDSLDGWGTYAAASIPFEEHIDIQDLMDRQGGTSDVFSEERWPDHAVYLINLTTGLPTPLDVNSGSFQYVLDNPSQYWPNDPRAGESNLLFETVDEDVNGNGVMDPGEDTDFDGVLDQPNTLTGEPGDVDDMVWFYERETKTLLLKPILPLRPKTTYAIVVTDRLVGENGQSVRSPFDTVHHVAQRDALEPLPGHLLAHPELYGDLASRGWDGVAFAYTFTTQSVTDDLDAIRDGLYGEGTMAYLDEDFPPTYAPSTMQGGGAGCTTGPDIIVAPGEQFRDILRTLFLLAFEISGDVTDALLEPFSYLSHVVTVNFDSPYFLRDPDTVGLQDTFQMDAQTGEAEIATETLTMTIFVPIETETHQQPFDTAFYVHGYGSANAEPLPYAGYMVQNGVALVILNAEGHGVEIDDELINTFGSLFSTQCLTPTLGSILASRAEDIDGDGTPDSGVDFWTAYVFHTRDVVRQSVVDYMRSIRILSTFDGRPALPGNFPNSPITALAAGDAPNPGVVYDADIFPYEGLDIAGDFDGDGVPDVGGPDNQIFFTGGSLGGIVSGIMAGVEPSIRSSVPIVGAGGLTDVSARSNNGGVLRAMHLRLMGPLVITNPASERGDNTACAEDEVSMYFYSSERNKRQESEFACISRDVAGADDVIVVGNFVNNEKRCASATRGEEGRFQVPFPADPDDPIYVEIHPGRAADFDYGTCTYTGERGDDVIVIDTFQVGAEDCDSCARYQQREWARGERLVSPAMGFGHRRQSADLRRLLFLAQVGLEPADPINYARRVFLEPLGQPVNLLVVNSVGDQNVPLSGGNAYARAAGVLPFLPPDAPDHLRDWRAPASFEVNYPGYASPNDLLIGLGVLEGVDRLERHPMTDGPNDFLMDVDDLAEGAYRFQPDGRHQSNEPDAVTHPRLERPLRWVRQSRAARSNTDDVWSPVPGQDVSGLLNHYVVPAGVHGFDELVYDQNLPWDPAQYLINLISRYGITNGQDLHYFTNPEGHTCLEDSSCPHIGE